MALKETPICDFGWTPQGFTLPATDGRSYSLDALRGENGTVVMFICNHCPYVLAVLGRLIDDARTLQEMGIGVAAICANDATTHPADSFENMARMARDHAFPFPYLHDESQEVAREWGAACTPDFFGFNAAMELQYRGRLDDAGKGAAGPDTRRELIKAMQMVRETGEGPRAQIPSMGCSIKWKAA